MSLKTFFNPHAVAIIGASKNSKKLGRQIMDNIITGGFRGPVYPINLKGKKLAGRLVYRSLDDLPKEKISFLLLIIAIPARFVLAEIEKCVVLGIKNIIIISAGFKEEGKEGLKLEKKISDLARQHNLHILGPNCLGLINTWQGLNATFSAADKETGNSALLSQSGAVGSAALDWLKLKDFNFGYFVSLGNKAVIEENQVLSYLASDNRIDLIVAYLEEIKDGRRFMEIVSRLAKHKPVAILKAGTSDAGSNLAKSHTGSLAGSAAAVQTGLKRAGAIILNNLEELFNLMLVFRKESWHNNGPQDLYIITNAGGVAVISADGISRQKLAFGGSQDILGDADAARYRTVLAKTLAQKKVNNLLVLLTPQTTTETIATAQAIIELSKKYPHKLIMTSFVGGKEVASARSLLAQKNVPSFDYPGEAIRSFKKLVSYKESLRTLRPYKKNKEKLSKVKKASPDYLAAFRLLKKYKIPVSRTLVYDEKKIKNYSYPVVLKSVGPDFSHKTDLGGVQTNLNNPRQLKLAVQRMKSNNIRAWRNPKNYLVVQKQDSKFQEIILGFKRDSSFGPLLMIGQGGIYAEVFKDFQLAISDLNLSEARRLIKNLNIYPILNGARSQRKYDINALAQALLNLARLANDHPEILELDINPLFVFEHGVKAADVLIIV